ncbi:methyltransferase domain-containing protein [Arthrobacter sp. GMC3]|uniref:methyltransferase domain-containing protein n=1 Tax=Arthrobacter sp. GMC3 TaxID=2058894 RepID=UPI000CE5072C|nr:methyltransferase domain-containing protein [Arthrobacter sp. GMC3]
MTSSLTASIAGLQAALGVNSEFPTPVGALANVFFGGRRIWTFRVDPAQWDPQLGRLTVDWPPALVPHLSGTSVAKLEILQELGLPASYVAEGTARFRDHSDELQLLDPLSGTELVVNKWGRMAKSFESVNTRLMTDVLASAKSLITLLADTMDLDLFITGGTLLGLVRDGKLIANDDDADLAYVSRHENPSDIVLESYEVERVLAEHGLETVRHSSGHLQVMFGGTEFTDGYYVDIFTYFVAEGWFYGTFHAREISRDVTVFPLGTITAGELQLPIPANSEQMLRAIYGPTWRTPDPAFEFHTPDAAQRRFYWWLNHFDKFREDWEDYHRRLISRDQEPAASALSSWLIAELEPGSTVLEVGCGLGADALALAAAGHHVLACDYSRPAIATARSRSGSAAGNREPLNSLAQFTVANVCSIRDMAQLVKQAAALAGPGVPIQVVSKNLLEDLHFLGRDNTLMVLSHLLDRGGRAYLQMRSPQPTEESRDPYQPDGEKVFDLWDFRRRLAFYNLKIVKSRFIKDPEQDRTTISYIIGKGPHKMSVLDFPQRVTRKVARTLREMRGKGTEAHDAGSSGRRIARLEHDLQELQRKVLTLNRDLDESRRLNLRAAELMDVAFKQLSS